MKDRRLIGTRTGLTTKRKLQEFVAEAKDWMTPHSTGVDENSLVRTDCYIFPGAGNIGNQHSEIYPITSAVIAVHEDQAILLGTNNIAVYLEKGYACVAVFRDAAGKQKQLLLDVLFQGPVKLLGRNTESHRLHASVRVTHSDCTSRELPIASILPDSESIPEPLKAYDVDSAIYHIRGVHGLKTVKLAAINDAITVDQRVLSGGYARQRNVSPILGFSPPMQWQTQTVESVDGVYGGNMHGPEMFGVLCPTLPAPSGFTFDEHGRLIGKYALGSPSYQNMTHTVFKSHATHSIPQAALEKLDDTGLKTALVRTLEESKTPNPGSN